MYNYRVAFIVKGKQLNARFTSPIAYTGEADNQKKFREMATNAVQEYLLDARNVPATGKAEALALWPEILPSKGIIQPLDAFEITQKI